MRIAALILGLIGGLILLLYGLVGYGLATLGSLGDYQILSVVIPLACLAGAGIAMVNAPLGGAMLAASAAGTVWILGFNIVTVFPVALAGLGAAMAFWSVKSDPPPPRAVAAPPPAFAPPAAPGFMPPQMGYQPPTPGLAPELRQKWAALQKYDDEIRAAAETLRPFGPWYVERLGAEYLAVGDKAYLPRILAAVRAEAEATHGPAPRG